MDELARIVSLSEQVRAQTPLVESNRVAARLRRQKNQGSDAGKKVGDGWVRTPADELLLEMITRLGVMTVSQAHRYIYPTLKPETVRKRISMMEQAGLVKKIDTLAWAGVVVYPTVAGRRAVLEEDSPLLAMEPPSESTMLHRLLVTEEALKLVAQNIEIITEREARLYEMGMTPEKIEDRDVFLASKGVRRSVDGSRGVVPTHQNTEHGTVERYLIVPTPGAESQYRIPDLFEVTKNGELRAIEIEITPKRPARFRAILAAYREACVGHNPVPHGVKKTLKETGPKLRQLAGVRWIATDPVMAMLRGYPGGINPFSGKEDIGMVRPLWNSQIDTHLFFSHPSTWNLDRKAYPLSTAPLDVSHDPGLEYALHQAVLPANFRSTIREWRKWRKVWQQETANDADPVGFTHWIRKPGQLKKLQRR